MVDVGIFLNSFWCLSESWLIISNYLPRSSLFTNWLTSDMILLESKIEDDQQKQQDEDGQGQGQGWGSSSTPQPPPPHSIGKL